MALISPLDLKTILVEDVAGSIEIFSFLALILLCYVMARFNLPNKISLTLIALFAVLMASYMPGIYVLVLIIGGVVTYYSLTKIIR